MQAWHDYRANTPDHFFDRIHDFKGDIRHSPAAEDYELTADEIERIDFALNEYMAARGEHQDDHTTKLRQDRQTAADAIAAAVKGLDAALSAFDAIAKNPYAKSAVYAATQGEFSRRRHKSKRQDIDGLTKAVKSLKQLHTVAQRAQTEPPSDGLATFPEGAQADPALTLLLFRLRNICRLRAADAEMPLTTNTAIAEFIAEILALAGIHTRKGKAYNTKSILNRLPKMDDTFPPANSPEVLRAGGITQKT
ncbi:MAG: hypothetical protein JNK97_04875 [Zoogloea sp.]|nr:hypothetical protein [Zoogloea sp.]